MRVAKEFSDQACLERLRHDDVRAFDELFDMHAAALCRFANGYLKNRSDAEEVAQDCFLKVWERRHTFTETIVFKTYLYTTAYRAIIKQMRRQRYWIFENCDEQLLIEEVNPTEVLEHEELERLYQAALAQLSPRRREIFTLSRQQGLPNAAIAEELNITVKCVENQMTHALKALKLYFQAHGIPLSVVLALLYSR